MKITNENTAKKEINNKIGKKENLFSDINQKLDFIINNSIFPPKKDDKNDNTNKFNIIQTTNDLNIKQIKEEFQPKINNQNNESSNIQKEKSIKRLDILRLINDDSLSKFFLFNLKNGNSNIIYNENFNDIFNENESLFYLYNNDKEKSQFINIEEVRELKNNDINLIFGEQPCDIYFKLKSIKKKEKEKNIMSLAQYLNNLNKFTFKECSNTLKENMMDIYYGDDNSISQNEFKNKNDNYYNQNSNINSNVLKEPVIINQQNFIEKNKLNGLLLKSSNNSLNETNNSKFALIKKEICNKYNLKLKRKKKIDELIKECKYDRHKKNFCKRKRAFRKKK